MATKLSAEEVLRRAVGKAARASRRAEYAALLASNAWWHARELARGVAAGCEHDPVNAISDCVSTVSATASNLCGDVGSLERQAAQLARLMGAEEAAR